MSTRISFGQISDRILERLFQNYGKLEDIQQQLSTGKRIQKASDDPVSVSQSMGLRSEVNQYTTFQRNINDGLAYLGTVDTTLQTANNLYQNMRERAIQASNDSNSADSRFFIGKEVRGMFDQMVALSNTTFKGEFIFSGTNTQAAPYAMRSGEAVVKTVPGLLDSPFGGVGVPSPLYDTLATDSIYTQNYTVAKYLIPGTVKADGLTEGTDYTVNYVQGEITYLTPAAATAAAAGIKVTFEWLRRSEKDLDGAQSRELEEGVTSRINSTASEVFGSDSEVNAWEAMINLLDGTLNNKPDKIRESIDAVDTSLKRQLGALSTSAARVQRLESTQIRNDERTIYTTKLQSDIEDVDFAKAISDFNMQQAVYDASLKMGAKALSKSLVDFL
jgi:flagellar hook-associated protein 3 FlgL